VTSKNFTNNGHHKHNIQTATMRQFSVVKDGHNDRDLCSEVIEFCTRQIPVFLLWGFPWISALFRCQWRGWSLYTVFSNVSSVYLAILAYLIHAMSLPRHFGLYKTSKLKAASLHKRRTTRKKPELRADMTGSVFRIVCTPQIPRRMGYEHDSMCKQQSQLQCCPCTRNLQ
jgi:hypothetical protein